VDVSGEGGPRCEGLKIGLRIIISLWSRFGSTNMMGIEGIELCFSVIREREIWEGGLHCTSSLRQRRRRKLSKKSVGPESYLENIGKSVEEVRARSG